MDGSNKRVLVTGGSGFIGKRLIGKLLLGGYEVTNIGKDRVENADNIILDLSSTDFSFLDNLNFDYCVHLAAFSSPARSKDRDAVMKLNYEATANLFSKLLDKGIKKSIFMSTVAVYDGSDMPLKEEDELNYNGHDYGGNVYGISKIKAERELESLREKGLHSITFRLGNCYGPGQQWKKEEILTLIPQVIVSALKDKKIEVFDKNPVRDYIYVDDVVDAIIAGFDSDYNGTLNLGTGVGTSVEEVAIRTKELIDSEIKFLNIETKIPQTVILDIEKIKSCLNWAPKTPFKVGLKNTVDYYKKIVGEEQIKLVKSTFHNEVETKKKLCEFIMKTDKLSMGDKCKEFEKSFSNYQGRKYSVLFNSGSSANLAIIQALLNLEILKKEEKVGFSALTWSTNVSPLIQLGLNPVPIDVSLENLNVNSNNFSEVLQREDLKALFLTNLLGFCGDLDRVKEICDEKGIVLIEDNCEALGSEFGGKKLGNFGIASTFSFFVGHHMSTIEGGVVCTDSVEIYRMLKMVRTHGWSRDLDPENAKKLKEEYGIDDFFNKYSFYCLGYNLRPTEITGFIGLEQINYAEEIVKKRAQNFAKLQEASLGNPQIKKIESGHMDVVSNFAYPLIFDDKETFEKYKIDFEKNVEIRPIVGGSIVNQPFFKKYLRGKDLSYSCPNAEKIHSCGFYFPNNHELSDEEISRLQKLMKVKDISNHISVYNSNSVSSKVMKKAIITGVTGQDGSYLAEFLLEKGYEVHGLVRRTSSFNRDRLKHIYKSSKKRHVSFFLHYGDMTDTSSLVRLISEVRPDEIYNLAAQSHVKVSFDIPEYTANADALGVLKVLESVKKLGLTNTKIYQASTSELFGKATEFPQNENTPFHPRSPYGVAKLYGHWMMKNYRDSYDMFACNGILFNHESPRRGESFVTRKITLGVAGIKLGKEDKIYLGNLDAKRDWGHAKDFIEAMWLMMQQEKPEDYVIATGVAHSVREFVEESFNCIGIKIKWEGSGINEKGIDEATGNILIEVDPDYFRPSEVEYLLGDFTKARSKLGWEPKIKFKELVKLMVEADLEHLSKSNN